MSLNWRKCFLCNGYGELTIGENFTKLLKSKNVTCPICHGKGHIPVKLFPFHPWRKDRKNDK